MRYALAAAAIAGAASASWSHGDGSWGHGGDAGSWGPPSNGTGEVYVTEVVTAFTTFCPEATVITHGSSTWSVSASQTLTITGPVTITKPMTTAPATTAPVTTSVSKPMGTGSSSKPVGPVGTGSSSKPSASASMSKKPTPSGTAPGTGSMTATSSAPIASYTGAASHLQAGAAGALAIFGLVAAL